MLFVELYVELPWAIQQTFVDSNCGRFFCGTFISALGNPLIWTLLVGTISTWNLKNNWEGNRFPGSGSTLSEFESEAVMCLNLVKMVELGVT